jgi:hypothetical protein
MFLKSSLPKLKRCGFFFSNLVKFWSDSFSHPNTVDRPCELLLSPKTENSTVAGSVAARS